MADFDDIKEIRLRVDDPPGFQDFIETASLPDTPAPYTAYKLTTTGAYMSSDTDTGATDDDYDVLQLRVSDSRISAWIDAYGLNKAEYKSLEAIKSRLGQELTLSKMQGGAETTEFTGLATQYAYYKGLVSDAKEKYNTSINNNTGRYGASKAVEIAGGEV